MRKQATMTVSHRINRTADTEIVNYWMIEYVKYVMFIEIGNTVTGYQSTRNYLK